MVNIAIVGVGFMGMIHYLAAAKAAGAKVVALAAATPRSWLATGRASRATSGRVAPDGPIRRDLLPGFRGHAGGSPR